MIKEKSKRIGVLSCALLLYLLTNGCKSNGSSSMEENGSMEVKTPVTVLTVGRQSIQNVEWLNASSTILNKSPVKSTIDGFIVQSSLLPGEPVTAGQVLFILKTKEAQVIGNLLPDSLKISGEIKIRAPKNGFIAALSQQQGDYVQVGEQLCLIADQSSFVFLLQVPFTLIKFVKINQPVALTLPDGREIEGRITSSMPALDSVSQTRQFIIKLAQPPEIPEKLIARVKLVTQYVAQAQVLPSSAVLSDESQSAFWIMKMINDTTAVKVPVKRGIITDSLVQITEPQFSPDTKILVSGNYGLPDTAFVKIEK